VKIPYASIGHSLLPLSHAGAHSRSRSFATEATMNRLNRLLWNLRIWKDTRAQDMIEYALMAGFVAVAAGAILPGVSTSISTIFSKVASVMTAAAATS
jgi:pilus assembly protein Flp/PilA